MADSDEFPIEIYRELLEKSELTVEQLEWALVEKEASGKRLGEILVRSGVADGLYRFLSDWMRKLPGVELVDVTGRRAADVAATLLGP